jgi:hypothetical protein
LEVIVADMLANGAAWLTGQLKAVAGSAVTYRRGSDEAEVVATVGRSQFEAANQAGVVETWESRDFLVTTADLPYGDPERGDVIIEASGETVVEYEVTSPRGVPEWHYGDAFRSIVRIHTVQTDAGVTYLATELGEQLTTEAGEPLAI